MILNGYLDNFEHFFGLEMGSEVTFYIVAQVIENIFFMKFLYFILFYITPITPFFCTYHGLLLPSFWFLKDFK